MHEYNIYQSIPNLRILAMYLTLNLARFCVILQHSCLFMLGLYLKVGLSHVPRISKNFVISFMIVAIVAP
jgi:hypothetical protein